MPKSYEFFFVDSGNPILAVATVNNLLRQTVLLFPASLLVVEGGGFEPPKSTTSDLQSDPFGHSGTPPGDIFIQF